MNNRLNQIRELAAQIAPLITQEVVDLEKADCQDSPLYDLLAEAEPEILALASIES